MTLRSKTALLMAMVAALAVTISGYFSLSLLEQSLRRSILQGAESLASTTADSIDRFLEEILQDTRAIAAQMPRSLLQSGNVAGLTAFLQRVERHFPHFENGLFILTPEGDLLADYPAHVELHGKNFAFRQYYQRALQERAAIIGKPYVSARTGFLVLTFTVPVWGEGQQLLGLLNASVRLASPRALGGITQRHFGETGYLYVYDSSRMMILHPQPGRIGKRDVPFGANRLFDQALQGFEGSGETVNSRGIYMLAAFTHSKLMDWVVVAQQPGSEAFAPLRQARFKLLLVLLASAALAAAIGVVAVRRVTLPLIRLEAAARHLSSVAPGGTPESADAGAILAVLEQEYAGGEIGSLARTLREQQQQLGESIGALNDASETWEKTFNSVQDAIFVADRKCRIQRLNRAARELFQLSEAEIIGMPCYRLIHGTDQPPAACPGLQTLNSGRPDKVELTDSLLPGVYEETTTLLAEGEQGGSTTVHLLKDLTQIKETESQIKRLAYYDTLTGLANRTLFIERLNTMLVALRGTERMTAVLFVDLDEFKVVNDTLGHSAGDQLLQVVARRLEGCMRQTDLVARFGGDEFVISISPLGSASDVTEIAEKILRILAEPMELGGKRIRSSASIGIALFPQDGEDTETLLKHADAAMYQAKSQGRNGFQMFSEEMENRVQQSLREAQVEFQGEETFS